MARFVKMKTGRHFVEIRKKGFPYISKSFHDIKDARKFARTVESEMERGVFEDYSGARGTTLREILVRYRDERTAVKKGVLCVWRRDYLSFIQYIVQTTRLAK